MVIIGILLLVIFGLLVLLFCFQEHNMTKIALRITELEHQLTQHDEHITTLEVEKACDVVNEIRRSRSL